MKKVISQIIFLLVFSCNLNAQITITESDVPMIGDVQAAIEADVTPGISIGSPGANQTYDFSGLIGIDTTISEFISPTGTPGENSFPTATLAVESGGDISYLEINSTATLFLGVSVDTSGMGDYFDLVYDPSIKFIELPTTYGTSYMDESGFSITADGSDLGFDSIRIISREVKNVNFDGYGTVITPLGSFDGLREEAITTSYDTSQAYLFGIWQTLLTDMSIDTSYNWYSKDSKGILVSVDIQDGEISYVEYQDLNPTIMVPSAAFTYIDQGLGVVDFTDQSLNQPTSWMWDFGDSNTSTLQNPSHTFASSGMYNVCLTATNSAGSDTNCQMIDIEVVAAPVAAFTYTDQGQGEVDFMDLSTNQPDSWMWDFGDGNVSTDQNPSHNYATNGMYEVCLIVSNIAGADTSCQTLDVIVTSVNTLTVDLKVDLFPNPTSDWLSLKLESDEIRNLQFVLYNELGQAVIVRQIESMGQYYFDIKDFSTGVYYFLLKTEQGQFVSNGRIIKN